MDNKNQFSSSSSSSSFTENLFGPKDVSSASSSGLFDTVFGPSSTGLGRHPSHSALSKNQEFGGAYGSGKPSTQDYKTQRNISVKDGNGDPVYQNETAKPRASYLSSSIYYGGQEFYPPNTQTTNPPYTFKKDEGDSDPNGGSASRGNWWKGSLYY